MDDNDFASTESAEGFTPEEQAAFDAYERGDDAPAAAPVAPAVAEAAPAGGDETGAAAPEGGEAVPGSEIDPNGQARDEKGKFVPHGAFHEERERRKAVEKELNDLREKYARGDERLRVLSEAMQARPAAAAQPAAEAPKVPNPEEDIFGYAKHLEQQIADLKSGFTKQTEEQRVAAERKAVRDDYVADAQRFVATEPSFADAYNHLYQSRALELAISGVPQEQLIPTIQAEEMEIAAACRRAGISPAERIFAMAKARGFTPKAAEAAPAPAAAPAETAAQKAERVAAGQAGPGKSLSAAGGAPAGEVTLEMLGSMSETEFEAFANKNPEKLARLMGAEA